MPVFYTFFRKQKAISTKLSKERFYIQVGRMQIVYFINVNDDAEIMNDQAKWNITIDQGFNHDRSERSRMFVIRKKHKGHTQVKFFQIYFQENRL